MKNELYTQAHKMPALRSELWPNWHSERIFHLIRIARNENQTKQIKNKREEKYNRSRGKTEQEMELPNIFCFNIEFR